MHLISLLVGMVFILSSIQQVSSKEKDLSYLSNSSRSLILKRSLSSSDSKGSSQSTNTEDEEVHQAAATLMDINSSQKPKPLNDMQIPQKARSSRKRKASELDQGTIKFYYSRYSNKPTSHRILSQNRYTVSKRNRLQRMKENAPEDYQRYLEKKRISNNARYRKMRALAPRTDQKEYKPRRLKANPAKSTIKNRKWMAKIQNNEPERFEEMMQRRRSACRKFWNTMSAEEKKQKKKNS